MLIFLKIQVKGSKANTAVTIIAPITTTTIEPSKAAFADGIIFKTEITAVWNK